MSKRRPRLKFCRLCELPVGGAGVRVSRLDSEKLARWWKKRLKTKWSVVNATNTQYCQFCLWDAKLIGNDGDVEEGCDWWTKFDTDPYFKKYYFEEEVIQPCAVEISPLSSSEQLLFEDSSSEEDDGVDSTSGRRSRWWPHVIPTDCNYCHESFRSQRAARLHAEDVHADLFNKISCSLCDRMLSTENRLRRHQFLMHGVPAPRHKKSKVRVRVKCLYCRRTHLDQVNLRIHVARCHPEKVRKCPVYGCVEYFTTEAARRLHLEEQHADEAEVRRYRCKKCDFKAKEPVVLRRHVLYKHGTGVKVECPECKLLFNSAYALKKHTGNVHCKKQTCHLCRRQVKDLQYHLRSAACLKCKEIIPCRGQTHSHRKTCIARC